MFSYEFCEPFKDTFLFRTPLVAASVILLKLDKITQPEKGCISHRKRKSSGIHPLLRKQFTPTGFLNKCEEIRRKLRIYLHSLKKYLMESFMFNTVIMTASYKIYKVTAIFWKSLHALKLFVNFIWLFLRAPCFNSFMTEVPII